MQLRFGSPPLPREHGAWAMLLTPPLAAIFAEGLDLMATLAIFGWFSAYALRGPIEALTGKGASGRAGMAHAEPEVAYLWILIFGGLAALLLVPVVLYQPLALGLLAGAGLLLGLVFWLAQQGATRSLLAGLLAVSGLVAGAPLYYLVARGSVPPQAWALTYTCFAFFAGSIFRVKSVARERRHAAFRWVSVGVHLLFVAAAALLAALGQMPILLPLSLVPPLGWAIYCAWQAAKPKAANLGRVGMSELWLTLLFAAMAIGALWISL